MFVIVYLSQTGDPKTSPRSLLSYLQNSIIADEGGIEPFCFVILNTTCWHHGPDEVREWITKFSDQLYVFSLISSYFPFFSFVDFKNFKISSSLSVYKHTKNKQNIT